jgi:hypothetical protein
LKWVFTCCKILWHGANGFTSLLKESVLQFSFALKIHCFGHVWTLKAWVQ